MVFIGGLWVGIVISVISYSIRISIITRDYKTKENEYIHKIRTNELYEEGYTVLLREYNKVVGLLDYYKRNSNDIHIDDDIKAALRFAMMYSHPDKGNCKDSNEFIKFKRLYDKYK